MPVCFGLMLASCLRASFRFSSRFNLLGRTSSSLFALTLLIAGTGTAFAQATAPAVALGSVNVGASATGTVTFNFSASAAVASVSVVTQGVTGLDFQPTAGSGGSCAARTYSSGNSCTVNVTFAPLGPGIRMGAAVLKDASGNAIGTGYVSGIGVGPIASVSPNPVTLYAGCGFGTVWYYPYDQTITCAPYPGYTPSAPLSTAISGGYLSADTVGNLYLADTTNFRIEELVAATGKIVALAGCADGDNACLENFPVPTPTPVNANTVSFYPLFPVVDGAGNIFFLDEANSNLVEEIYAGTHQIAVVAGYIGDTSITTTPTAAQHANFINPFGLTIDGAGNLYVADNLTGPVGVIEKITASTGTVAVIAGGGNTPTSATPIAPTSASLGEAAGIVTDAAGNLFFSESHSSVGFIDEISASDGKIRRIAGGGSSTAGLTPVAATSVNISSALPAIDPSGDIILPGPNSNPVNVGVPYTQTYLNGSYLKISPSQGTVVAVPTTYRTLVNLGTVVQGQGFSEYCESMAIDGTGTIYCLTGSDGQAPTGSTLDVITKIAPTSYGLTFPTSTPTGTKDTTDGAEFSLLSNLGNGPLTISTPLMGVNPSISSGFTLDNATTCPEVSSSSASRTVAGGASCLLAIDFTPVAGGTASGSVVVSDDSGSVAGTMQTIPLQGTGLQNGDSTSVLVSASPSSVNSGTAVAITVIVSDSTTPGTVPTGSVTFTDNVGNTTVSLNGGNPVPLTNGSATILATLSGGGTHTITAYYAGVSGSFSASSGSASAQITAALATTSLAAVTAPSSALAGGSLTVSTTLTQTTAPTGPVAGANIAFTITAPDSTMTTQSATTSANGLASVNFTPTQVGVYSIAAQFAGTSSLAASTSTSASTTVYQRTSLALASASGTAGAPVNLTATLTTVPAGAAVAGQSVTFSTSVSGVGPVTATTDANGVATAQVVFPAAGSFQATATFSNPGSFFTDAAGDLPPAATTASSSVTVAKATTSLSALTVPSTALVGSPLTVSTTLNRTSAPVGAATGAPVVFTFTAPAVGDTQTVITDANGLASTSYTPSVSGLYSITAQFAGTVTLFGATPSSASLTVYQRTSLALAPPASGTAGSAVTLSATLTNVPGGAPLAGQTVTFSTTASGVGPLTATTDSNGLATVQVVFPNAGTFSVTASFSNLANFFADSNGNPLPDTSSSTVAISLATTNLSPLNPQPVALVGSSLTVSTILTRVSVPSGAVSSATVTFNFTAPSGAVSSQSVTTDGNGLALTNFTPTMSGVYSITAQFAGNAALTSASSASASVTAYQRTLLALASASGYAGTTLQLSASLTNVPEGTSLAGQTVTFTFAGTGAPSPATAVTNAMGVATAPVAFPAAGTFTATATFFNPGSFFTDSVGDLPVAATTATATVTVALATTSLSGVIVSPVAQVGSSLMVGTTLTRTTAPGVPVAGVPIVFTFTAPGGAVTTLNAATAINGLATVTFTPTTGGVYSIAAQFAGNAGLASSTASGASTTAYQRTLLVLAPPANATTGTPVTLSATLTTVPGGVPLAGQTVNFNFGLSGAGPMSALTDANGVATVQVAFPTAGTFTAQASFFNPNSFFTNSTGAFPPVADTSVATVMVVQAQAVTSLSALNAPTVAQIGGSLTVSTMLSRVSAPAGPVAGATIVFTLTAPDSSVTTLSATADLNGLASVSFTPATTGVYSIAARFAGTAALGAASSSSASVTVMASPALNFTLMAGMPATTPYGTTVYFTLSTATTPQCPTGSVQFYVDGSASGAPVTLSGASCSQPIGFQIATLTPGLHSLYAVYSGDSTFFGQTSATLSYMVTANSTSVTLAASSGTVNVGQPLTLTATVTPASAGGLPPVGSVVFYDGTTQLGTGSTLTTAAPYTSTLTVPSLSAGPHSITATFVDSDGNYGGSSSPLATETVNLNVSTINWTPSPTEFPYGTALGAGQLNATAVDANNNPVSGSFSYNFTSGTVLPTGTVNLTATFTPSDPTTYAGNSATVTLTVDPSVLTVTAASLSTTYGATLPTFTYQITGFVNNDPSSVVSGQASCTTTATSTSPVTTYPITCTQGSLTAQNYSFQFASGTLTVAQANASVTPAAATKVYGTADATLTGSLSGFLASDNVVATYSRNPGETVAGSYTISATLSPTAVLANYNITYNTAAFTITPAPLTITAGSYTGVYDSNTHALSACVVSSNPDGLTCSNNHVGPVGPDVGSGTVTPVISGSTGNYTVTYNNGSWSITAKPVTVTAGSYTGPYDGNVHSPSPCTSSYAGVTCANSPASVGPGVGSGAVSSVTSFATGSAADYTVTSVAGTFSITKAAASVTPNNATKVYGTIDPALTGTLSGFLPADKVTATYTRASGTNVGSYAISAVLSPAAALANYNITYNTAAFTITPVALTIAAGSSSKTYGSALPVISASYSGLTGGDTAASLPTPPVCSTTATSASNVGNYATSCSGAVDGNYSISYKIGTLTITPAALTVAATPLTLSYNGSKVSSSQLTYTVTGFVLGQTTATDLTGSPSETNNTPTSGTVGSYTITIGAGTLKLNSAYSTDYSIAFVSAPLTISPAVLTVTATSQTDVYGAIDQDNCGNRNNHLAYTITGFVNGQNQYQVLSGSPSETTTETVKSGVGTYPITITQGSLKLSSTYANDYTIVFVNGAVTVTPAKLAVVANSYSRAINKPNPAFGYTIIGFVNGDTQSSAVTGVAACCSTTATSSSPVGNYIISIGAGSLAAKNYTFTTVNGVLVVYNPNNRNDPHCDGFGNFRGNPQWDFNNWPDSPSFNFYWGNGWGGGPNIIAR